MAPKDIEKTAFVCEQGLFEFRKKPLGLSSAPDQFQRIMNKVLAGYIGKFVLVYLDDIVVYSKNPKDHARLLRLVFERLQEAALNLNPEKCNFWKEN